VLEPVPLEGNGFTVRTNATTGKEQVLTGDILDHLKRRLPEDAFCVLAITMTDLYPEPSWNFVFGQASLRGRVGVYSFARYAPAFSGQERGKDYEEILLRRSAKVLAHETAHMFGIEHCIFFTCILNGSNHLAESDSRPLELCPMCLRKLHASVGFDAVARYQRLLAVYRKLRLEPEARWVERRVEWIEKGKGFGEEGK